MQRLPQMHAVNDKVTGRAATSGDGCACLVLNGDTKFHVILSLGGNTVINQSICSIDSGCDGDIAYIGFRSGIEFYRALDACIVEKIKVRGICDHFSYACHVLFLILTYRKGSMIDDVVDRDGQAIFARVCECVDFRLERRKSPFVFDDKLPVEIHSGDMRHRTKTQYKPLLEAMPGNSDLSFIPDPANMVTKSGSLVEIIVRSGHRHRNSLL